MNSRLKGLAVLTASLVGIAVSGVGHAAATYGNLDTTGFGTASVLAYRDAVYMGTNGVIQNGNWTIDTTGGFEVALRAKNRSDFSLFDGPTGTYKVPAGICGVAPYAAACGSGIRAGWNYEFSVNTRAGANNGNNPDLTQIGARIRVDTDPTAGQVWSLWIDVTSNWGDNAYWDGVDEAGPTDERRVAAGPALVGEFGVQQSVNPMFANSLFQPGFNPFAEGLYDIQLAVADCDLNGTTVCTARASTSITVQVPEPGTLALLGLGLLGAGFARRRKQ